MLPLEKTNWRLLLSTILIFGLPTIWLLLLTLNVNTKFNFEEAKQVDKFLILGIGENQWWYVTLNIASVIFPFLLSFDKKVHFYKKWKYMFPGMLLVAIFFLAWDIWFTKIGIWGFNDRYTNFMIMELPLGEWLFFFTVPYCCIFVYECLISYYKGDPLKKFDNIISGLLIGTFLAVAFSNITKAYTSWAFLFAAAIVIFHHLFVPNTYRTKFYIAYIICLIPFTLINGALTGGFNLEPVVVYNDAHNLTSTLGFRFVSIPLDDFVYGFFMIFANVTLFEFFKSKSQDLPLRP